MVMTLMLSSVSLWAQEPIVDTDTLSADTITDPEWYVAPGIPDSLRAPFSDMHLAPRRAAANSCLVDSILTFNIDSVLSEGTYYTYDASGRVICTTVWTYNPDGSRIGKSKNEYGFDASGKQNMTAVYEWDATTNDWKGTSKYEYVYTSGRMTSNTSFVWIGAAWVADKRYTYQYDAAGRETEYYEYNRNTSTNQLEPTKGRIQTWYDATTKTLEILYTAFKNGQPFTGTKKELGFDTEGNKILDASSTMVNGVWVGSSKEEWAYTDGVLTMRATYGWANGGWAGSLKETWGFDTEGRTILHEQYGWYNNDWSMTLREKAGFDAYGNQTLIENYTGANGVTTGTQKEEYTFDAKGNKTLSMIYTWSAASGQWVNKYKEIWEFNGPKDTDTTLHEKYSWKNDDWSKILEAVNEYQDGKLVRTESYKWVSGEKIGTKYVLYTYDSDKKKTQTLTYHWVSPAWVDSLKETWLYDHKKEILHEKYAFVNSAWTIILREKTGYTADYKYITLEENYKWEDGVRIGTKKEETVYASGKNKSAVTTFTWVDNAWVYATYETWIPSSAQPTLHEKAEYDGANWTMTLQENTTYDGTTVIGVENYTRQGTGWSVMKEDYVYSGGQRTETIVYAYSNGVWEKSTRAVVGYTAGDTAVSATNYTWNGSTWIGSGTRTKTTTENGKVTELLTQNWPDGATDWTNSKIVQHTFNPDGEEILTYNADWTNGAWKMTSMNRVDIIIDSEGRTLLNASWMCGADGVWRGVQKDTASYTVSGKPIYIARFISWARKDWVPSYRVDYEYDAAERLLSEQRMDYKRNMWVGNYRNEYRYDNLGRQVMTAYYDEWDNGWVGSKKTEQELDENNRVVSSILSVWGATDWRPVFRTLYKYDSSGREIEQVVQNYSNNTWTSTDKYVKEYFGKILVKDNMYIWVDGQWMYSSQHEIFYDNDGQAKLRREINGTWDLGNLLLYADNHYFYDCDVHYYTIRFVNDDGVVLKSDKFAEGAIPSYSGDSPTKVADAQYTYVFAGWDSEFVVVTGDATYTATFTATKRSYTITWLNDDGSLIDQTVVEHGVVPTHADATKAATEEYTYTFAGWNVDPLAVTGEATYTATFAATKRSYTITFKNGDEVLQSGAVEYGLMPTYTGATPIKNADAQYTYTFNGWDSELSAVTEDRVYTAIYGCSVNSYTITWLNDDHTQIDQTTVLYGVVPTHADATKPETDEYTYTFSGWDVTPVAVTGEATYSATFRETLRSYTITWLNSDSSPIDQTVVEYGVVPTHEDATKPNTAEYTYTFTGWDVTPVAVTGDATYTATFSAVKNSYTVTFKNGDEVLLSGAVEYGLMPTYTGATPTRAEDAQYTYTFAGWDQELSAVTGNATYTATYSTTTKSYTITWLNDDNTQIDQTIVLYGIVPTHANPTKPETDEYTYTFSGWDVTPVAVTGEATYSATFAATKKTYTITFKNGDEVLQSSAVEYGLVPTYTGATPSQPSDAQYSYSFVGWDVTPVAVTGEATYTAVFDSVVNTYTVIFYFEDGVTEIDRMTLPYGAVPSTNYIPGRNAEEHCYYSFAGWYPEIAPVTGDASYTPTYTVHYNEYTIIFRNYDRSELQRSNVPYGTMPSYDGAEPVRPRTAQYTYTFAGWTPELTVVEGNATYTATYESTVNSYTIIFLDEDGTELDRAEVPYGQVPSTAVVPTKEPDEEYTYTFAGWSPRLTKVTSDATYTATYRATAKTHEGLWNVESGATATKVLINGMIYIRRGDKTYTPTGVLVE